MNDAIVGNPEHPIVLSDEDPVRDDGVSPLVAASKRGRKKLSALNRMATRKHLAATKASKITKKAYDVDEGERLCPMCYYI